MKEFSLNLGPMIRSGLRPELRARLNQHFAEDSFGLVGSRTGLKGFEEPVDPFAGSQTVVYPWPQLVRLNHETFLMGPTSMKRVTEGGTWTAATVTPVQLDGATPAVITGNDVWHRADMGGAWYLFNGTTTIFKHGIAELHGGAAQVFAQSSIPISSGCYHQGRVITGGFQKDAFWDASWQAIMATFQGYAPNELAPQPDDVGQNYILWSSVGVGDFPLFLFFPDIYNYDLYQGAQDGVTAARRNTFGLMPMPFQGKVLAILPLGEGIVVYGEDAICMMRSFQNEFASGYAPVAVHRVGIYSRAAVVANSSEHLFVDTSGNLWVVSAKGFQRLGYSEFLLDQLGAGLRMWWDEHMEDFYISNTRSFVFNAQGLYEVPKRVIAPTFVDGAVLALTADVAKTREEVYELTYDDAGYLTTNPFDFGLRALKTISGISVGFNSAAPVWVSVKYRYTSVQDFYQTRWVLLNKEGHATVRASAVEFKVCIRFQSTEDLHVDHVYVKWQSADKRNIRGFIPQASVGGGEEDDSAATT